MIEIPVAQLLTLLKEQAYPVCCVSTGTGIGGEDGMSIHTEKYRVDLTRAPTEKEKADIPVFANAFIPSTVDTTKSEVQALTEKVAALEAQLVAVAALIKKPPK